MAFSRNTSEISEGSALRPEPSDQSGLNLWLPVATAVTFAGLLALGYQHSDGGRHLGFAWLLSTWFVLSICLGGLFFVAIQHLTRSGWSVTLRRSAEILGAAIVSPILLLVPLLAMLLSGHSSVYVWNDASLVASDAVLQGKQSYLNAPFFSARTIIYAVVWLLSAGWLLTTSRRQDNSGDKRLTLLMEQRSAPILIALAVTTTFAAFDWLMSLDPYWFSTIFGIYVFSGGMVGALAVLALVAAFRVRAGSRLVSVEHLHDITKLLFGFNCFWAYIAFSQYLLIWYANIPEETVWLKHRQEHGWQIVTQTLAVGHFLIPFVLMMPRAAKRSPVFVIAASLLLLAMHWLDLYWLVYPQFSVSPSLGLTELLAFGFAVSATSVAGLRLAKSTSLIPLKDPRLRESVSHHVV